MTKTNGTETSSNQTTARPSLTAGLYLVDPARTTVAFSMREFFGLMPVHGTFPVTEGTVVVEDRLDRSAVRISLDPAGFHTDKPKRDADIVSPKWLDASSYPEMSYAGHLAETATGWQVTGRLTVHGVTHPVDLLLTSSEQSGDECHVTAEATIDRSDFGVARAIPFVGRSLTVRIDVVAVRS